jgi:hypothetical protein
MFPQLCPAGGNGYVGRFVCFIPRGATKRSAQLCFFAEPPRALYGRGDRAAPINCSADPDGEAAGVARFGGLSLLPTNVCSSE